MPRGGETRRPRTRPESGLQTQRRACYFCECTDVLREGDLSQWHGSRVTRWICSRIKLWQLIWQLISKLASCSGNGISEFAKPNQPVLFNNRGLGLRAAGEGHRCSRRCPVCPAGSVTAELAIKRPNIIKFVSISIIVVSITIIVVSITLLVFRFRWS